jgi:hypothetical protein
VKLRNVSGYPLVIRKYARTVGPGEVIDTAELAGYDPALDGVITGFEPVQDDPAPAKPKATAKTDGKDSKEKSA